MTRTYSYDLNYFGIRELENLITNDDYNDDNYYKPALFKSSFENIYEYYEIRKDKDKELSLKQYFYVVMPRLADLINKKNNNKLNENSIKYGCKFYLYQ